ncbi:reverse transcriptase and recombinase [Lasius niger]|uniref:Reverse transcriptase and recombinase n=1 Tax=Lasius niger TaxID=67767 RepID=A0A0J7K1N6_LASNI|nr:reverse transcriptase and recombinase [Lasius niger]
MFTPQINQVIDWLTEKYKAGASYGTLNTCRSALSLICGDRVGKNPIISRFLKGVFNEKPTRAKYQRIYDLEPVLKELERLYPLENLSLQDLTDKLVVLLAIVTAHRKQTLSLIKISNIRKINNGYEIEIPDRVKTTRPGSCQPLLTLSTFRGNLKLCVATTLERYLAVTKDPRGTSDSLFITTRKPFKAASKETISRWIRAFLGKCGIGAAYGPHSIRHAATSAAFKKGVDIAVIKSLAGWSEKSTVFNKFYNRPIVQKNNTFAEAILT